VGSFKFSIDKINEFYSCRGQQAARSHQYPGEIPTFFHQEEKRKLKQIKTLIGAYVLRKERKVLGKDLRLPASYFRVVFASWPMESEKASSSQEGIGNLSYQSRPCRVQQVLQAIIRD
jgi:hypothetical protein